MTNTKEKLQILDMVHHNPGEPPFESAFLDPRHLHSLGYTGQVLPDHVQAAVALDALDADLFPTGSAQRGWLDTFADRIESRIAAAKAAGLDCLAWTDFVVLPRALVRRFEDRIVVGASQSHQHDIKGEFTPNIHDAFLQHILRAQIDDIFTRFPALDGLVVRVGETYLHDLPYHTGGDPISRGVASHEEMLGLLRESVCVKHDKKLFYRTWLSGIDEDPEAYLAVCDRIEPHPNLYVVTKHCINDFHRTHPFSPTLGIGRHQQVAEVQCQREYEGKGAYPNYIAGGVIDGFEEYECLMPPASKQCLRDLQDGATFAGVLTWSRGGGWQGPYIEEEFWCAMNAYVLVHWVRDSSRPADEHLAGFFRQAGFADPDVERLVRIAQLSAKAVLRGIASTSNGINTWWTRDHYMGGVEDDGTPMAEAVTKVLAAGGLEAVVAERRKAVAMWREMEELAEAITSGTAGLREFIRASCRYGRLCFEVFATGWETLLCGKQGDQTGRYEHSRISDAIDRYDRAWEQWRRLAETTPACPTLYKDTYCRYVRDKGMFPHTGIGDSIERYRQLVQNGRSCCSRDSLRVS